MCSRGNHRDKEKFHDLEDRIGHDRQIDQQTESERNGSRSRTSRTRGAR
jgi:hypothetical protein